MAFGIYLFCLVFGVLFFGGIDPWVYTIVFMGVIAASLILLKRDVIKIVIPTAAAAPSGAEQGKKRTAESLFPGQEKGKPVHGKLGSWRFQWLKTDLSPLFFGFLIFLIFQMVPMPDGLLDFLSPEAGIDAVMSLPAGTTPPSGSGIHSSKTWRTLAPYSFPVRSSLIRWVVYGLFFFGLIRTLNSRKRIEAAIVVILLLGSFESLYGIIQTFSGYHHIWWLEDKNMNAVSGTYLNRNHFAGVMELGIILAIVYAGVIAGGERGGHVPSRWRLNFKNRFLKYFSGEGKYPRRFLIVFSGVVMGVGLLLSASRGGIISTAGALLIMGLFFLFRSSHRRKGYIILILFFMTMGYGIYIGIDDTLARFNFFDRDMEFRMVMAERAVALLKDYPLAGTGLGSFEYSYGRYQDPVHLNKFVNYAHNDWVQFLAESGLIGAALLLGGMGWFLVRTLGRWRSMHDDFAVCLGVAPFAGLFALGIHSVSDYNLRRPANMMLLIAVIAIGTAALHLGRHRHDKVQYEVRLIPMRGPGIVLVGIAACLIVWSGVWSVRHFVAEAYCSTELNMTLNRNPNPPQARIESAMAWDPANARYPFKLAMALSENRNRLMQQPEPDRKQWELSHEPIIAALERAIRLNPLNAMYHVRLGWEYSYLWRRPDFASRWLPAADLSMERAAYMAGEWAEYPLLHRDMGHYWTMRSKTYGPDDPERGRARTRAAWHYRKLLELEKAKAKELEAEIVGYVSRFYPGG